MKESDIKLLACPPHTPPLSFSSQTHKAIYIRACNIQLNLEIPRTCEVAARALEHDIICLKGQN